MIHLNVVHVLAGLGEASGVANAARRFARRQQERGDATVMVAPTFKWNPIYFGLLFAIRAWWLARKADEVWVHCSWTFPVWYGAWLARHLDKRLVVVPSGSFDPKRLGNHAGWKKRLVAPIDRWVLRQADEVLALCKDEIAWVRAFEPMAKVRLEKVPMFVKEGADRRPPISSTSPLRVLFLGRAEDPLKGVRFLERAMREMEPKPEAEGERRRIDLRIVRDHFGEELERDWAWCDALCLPTLSENFGLVVAEALERGKWVITTDGAPAWEPPEVPGAVEKSVGAKSGAEVEQWRARLCYLKGYRDGTDDERVAMLKAALFSLAGVQRVGLKDMRGEETRNS